MASEPAGRASGIERAIALAITPFVLLWDAFKNLVFGFFALVERLDPFAATWRLLKRFAPWVSRIWRAILPTLVRVKELLGRLAVRIGELLAPITKRLAPLVDAAWRLIRRVVTPVYAVLRRAGQEVLRVAAPALGLAARLWRRATAPFARFNRALQRRVQVVRARVAEILGRGGAARSAGGSLPE